MESRPSPANDSQPQQTNLSINPFQAQLFQQGSAENISQISSFPQHGINRINQNAVHQPSHKPLTITLNVSISAYRNLPGKQLKKQVLSTKDCNNSKIQVLKEDKISENTKEAFKMQILSSMKKKIFAITQFFKFHTFCDLQTQIASIRSPNNQLPPRIMFRLKEGMEFYCPSSPKTQIFQKIVIEECFFKNKPAQRLLRKIINSLNCNTLCAVYLYCSVMHQYKNYSYQILLNPQWKGPQIDEQINREILTNCQQLWATDRANLVNFVYERLKVSPYHNVDVCQFKGPYKYISQMMENFQLCPNKLASSYLFAFDKLIYTASKVTAIVELLYRKQSLDQKNNPQSEINCLLNKCLMYLNEIQSKYFHQGNSQLTLTKLKNQLYQLKIQKLLNEIANSSQYQIKNQVPPIQQISYDEYGDFFFVYKSLFDHNQIENYLNCSNQPILLTNYFDLSNVQTINTNTIFFNGIIQKIKLFESSLQKVPEKNANYRKDILQFLTLCQLISKLDYTRSQEPNPQKSYPGVNQTWSSSFEQRQLQIINNQAEILDKNSRINQLFNSLLKKLFQCRKYSVLIIMVAFLELKNNKLLKIEQELMFKVFRHYLSSTSQDLHIFIEEPQNVHKRLFGDQNLQQIIESDQLYSKCFKRLLQKTIGKRDYDKEDKVILDSKSIFTQYATHFVEDESKEGRKSSFSGILNEVVKLLYRLDKGRQDIQLSKLQDRKRLMIDLLQKQFELTKVNAQLLPFYTQCRKHQGSNNDFTSLIQQLKRPVRIIFSKYISCKLQNRLLESYLKPLETYQTQRSKQTNLIHKDYDFVCKMSDSNFFNLIQQIRSYSNCESNCSSHNSLFTNSTNSLKTETYCSNLSSIEPFKEKQVNDLIVKLSLQKALCIAYIGKSLKKIWKKVTPVYLEQTITQSQLSLKNLFTFHQNFILALDISSDFIDQALVIADGITVDHRLYIEMTKHVNQVTTNIHEIIKNINDLVEFLTQMQSFNQPKYDKGKIQKNHGKYSVSNVLYTQSVPYPRKKKVFDSIFTPALLTSITKHLYIKITMLMIAIEDQHLVYKSGKFTRKQVQQYVDIVTQTYNTENDLTQIIVFKLISLMGYLIETQYTTKANQINSMVSLMMFFMTKSWKYKVPDHMSLMYMVSVLNNTPISVQKLMKQFDEDVSLLKMMRYTRYVRYVWLEADLDKLKPEHRRSFDKDLTPQQAAEFSLEYIQELTIFTLRHYTKILYPEPSTNQHENLIELLQIQIQDVKFLSTLFNLTIKIVQNLHLHYLKQEEKFSIEQKKYFVQLLALNIKLIEISYQKLLHMLTFEREFYEDDSTQNQQQQYQNLARTVLKFKKFIQSLKNCHKEDSKSETYTVESCYLYISDVIVEVRTRAGDAYQKKYLKFFNFIGKKAPQMPKSEFFQLLIFEDKNTESEKTKSNNKLKLRHKNKALSSLTVSEKYKFLFQ